MHYRWSYEHDRALLSRILVDEVMQHIKLPRFVKLMLIKRRQRTGAIGVPRRPRRRGPLRYTQPSAVAVAQLVESRIVIPVVVGSSPISHPIRSLHTVPDRTELSANSRTRVAPDQGPG